MLTWLRLVCSYRSGVLLLLVPSLLPAITAFLIIGGGAPWVIVGFRTALQQRTPAYLQGRVYAAAGTMVATSQTISVALGAVLYNSSRLPHSAIVVTLVVGSCGLHLTVLIPKATVEVKV
jgi:hypothetical protein